MYSKKAGTTQDEGLRREMQNYLPGLTLVCGSQSELGGLLDNVAGSAAVGDEEVAILIGGLELEAGVAFVDGFKVLQELLELV